MKKIILFCALIPSVAIAQIIPVDLKVIQGPDAFDVQGATDTTKAALRFVNKQKTGFRFNLRTVEEFTPFDWSHSPADLKSRMNQAYQARKFWGKWNRVQVVATPPLVGPYTAGVAYPSPCAWDVGNYPVAVVNISPTYNGLIRARHAQVVIIHELGHVIGASHDSSWPKNIMDDAPLQYVDDNKLNWSFAGWARREIRFCKTQFEK